jgi:D-aspartate ligase
MKMQFNRDVTAFVFGMFETGLGVGRSLGRNGIKVFGFDFKKDIASYSKYVVFSLCPNPIKAESKFIDFIINKTKILDHKPIVYITADDFLEVFSKHRVLLEEYLLFNLPDETSINLAFNKSILYKELSILKIDCPKTFENISDCTYPLIIKGNNVNKWRSNVSGNDKVIFIKNYEDLCKNLEILDNLNVEYVLQEIIPGNDNTFFKYNTYRSKSGEILAEFVLQKLRQNPVRFGVGSLVKSVNNEEIRMLGRKVFEYLNYKGIGSAEFKYDERDNKYKLIEINTRYWQQNILPTECGINFPFIEYLYLTHSIYSNLLSKYTTGVKWINLYMDFSSFLKYRKEGLITLMDWIDDVKGDKVFSDFASDDIIPGLYEIFLSKKMKRIPSYFSKNI